MHHFKELQIWQRAMKLVKKVYDITASFPSEEKYGIVSQIRRCAVSIPSNIAEGAGRRTEKDFARFLSISLGSQFELETQLILTKDLSLISESILDSVTNELNEIQKMTRSLIDKFSKEINE